MFAPQPSTSSIRNRTRAAARNAVSKAAQTAIPDSTLGTGEPPDESDSSQIMPAKKPTYREALIGGSREGSPDPKTPGKNNSQSLASQGDDYERGITASQWPEEAQRPDSFREWIQNHPNLVSEQPRTPVRRSRRSRSHGSRPSVEFPRNAPALDVYASDTAVLDAHAHNTFPRDAQERITSPHTPPGGNLLPAHTIVLQKDKDAMPAQPDIITQAEEALSRDERERISRRYAKVSVVSGRDHSSSPSHGEGPSSKQKGKVVDPHNWGNIQLDPLE
ncbi:hypothetical protein BDZ97DRAFT_1925443 [Flammula alnicola]|nr:hypothetical protein BDZ97DRAFT_1925443 [Flammula alnicola]